MGCEHSEDEHAEMMADAAASVLAGDISPLLPLLTNENLQILLQGTVAELFVRSETMEIAVNYWRSLNNLVLKTFAVDSREESEFPEEFDIVMELREKFHNTVEEQAFMREGQADIDLLTAAPEERDDSWPGQYL